MFPLIRTRAARVLDVAIEFATLGEYRLADPIAQAAPARVATRRAEPAERLGGAQARPAARLVAPASAAALLLRPAPAATVAGVAAHLLALPAPAPETRVAVAEAPQRRRTGPASDRRRPVAVGDEAAIKQLALDFGGEVAKPPVRTRGGSAPAAPQPCLGPRR